MKLMSKESSDVTELINEVEQEEQERQEALVFKSRREALEKKNGTNMWGYSALGVEAKQAAMSMLSTKHGMYAKVPLMCKGESCPYKDGCMIFQYELAPFGEPCPVETAQIEARYIGYNNDFNLEDASFTDRALVSEIINLDIMIERTKSLMSSEGIPIVDVVAGVDTQGNVLMRPELSKSVEAYEKFTKKRNEMYQLMLATRKDKKVEVNEEVGIHTILETMMNVENNGGFIIEETPDEFK